MKLFKGLTVVVGIYVMLASIGVAGVLISNMIGLN